ncbi:hypothetical protein CANTEDRAFT_110531 [Yamadazyma tenuis ATCC 10573]|uniref:DNA repair metallo-beta-lactamase domain-containing protein n=2 Tax=Candida tenuis TaxID=2315449 RepID=G3BFR4_CANTC|nr:uncharacterized protein CANTEDRAFT_110531 [Yamadazyma tenuis ATCC 10573]EGV60716.1 hypothetical protein CANTEDRAFT_110531 [Yamadazyma tenuis ATCC 10573]
MLKKEPSFKNREDQVPAPKSLAPPKSLPNKSKRKPIPELKTLTFPVTGTHSYSISMDAFNYSPDPEMEIYFLSHFHADHYGGISKKWCYERVFESVDDFKDESMYRPLIYCSKTTGNLLTLKFGIDPRFIESLEFDVLYRVMRFDSMSPAFEKVSEMDIEGIYVTMMEANHCPGSGIFLFESKSTMASSKKYLHCGDFRVNKQMIQHKSLERFTLPNSTDVLDKVYLDTTYLSFQRRFPKQDLVCSEAAQLFHDLCQGNKPGLMTECFGLGRQSRITEFGSKSSKPKKKFLILVGKYIIGKERLAIAISKKINCPIYVSNAKSRGNHAEVVDACEIEYFKDHIIKNDLGDDSSDCIIHLVSMEVVEALENVSNYFKHNKYHEHFERCIALRPTGWSHAYDESTGFRFEQFESTDPINTSAENLNNGLSQICETCFNDTPFSYQIPIDAKKAFNKGQSKRNDLRIYSFPYSEHSSYRELTYFVLFLNIDQIIPTVNQDKCPKIMENHIVYWNIIKALRAGSRPTPKTNSMTYDKLPCLSIDPHIREKFQQLTIDNF